MKKRTRYIIDKEFQFRTTFSIVGLFTLVSVVILSIIAYNVVSNNIKIENIFQLENSNFNYLKDSPVAVPDPESRKAMKKVSANHDANMNTLQDIILYNRILLIVLMVLVVAQGFASYVILIRRTHRISGPIYVMSNYIKSVLEGETPHPRPLRVNDELQDFYALFTQLVERCNRLALGSAKSRSAESKSSPKR